MVPQVSREGPPSRRLATAKEAKKIRQQLLIGTLILVYITRIPAERMSDDALIDISRKECCFAQRATTS